MHEMQQHTNHLIANAFTQLKEGGVIEPAGSGKTFTKRGGLLVASDMEACEWIKSNIGIGFFNKYVVRIMHARPERFCGKSN
jgi:hypothetical protein